MIGDVAVLRASRAGLQCVRAMFGTTSGRAEWLARRAASPSDRGGLGSRVPGPTDRDRERDLRHLDRAEQRGEARIISIVMFSHTAKAALRVSVATWGPEDG
jgi:hypothetical protein